MELEQQQQGTLQRQTTAVGRINGQLRKTGSRRSMPTNTRCGCHEWGTRIRLQVERCIWGAEGVGSLAALTMTSRTDNGLSKSKSKTRQDETG